MEILYISVWKVDDFEVEEWNWRGKTGRNGKVDDALSTCVRCPQLTLPLPPLPPPLPPHHSPSPHPTPCSIFPPPKILFSFLYNLLHFCCSSFYLTLSSVSLSLLSPPSLSPPLLFLSLSVSLLVSIPVLSHLSLPILFHFSSSFSL